jgi:hypothetical protein
VLKIQTRVKRPANAEPSLGSAAKQPKIVPASTQKVVAPSSPARGSDDDRVEICSMMGVASTMSSSSGSSTGSSALESVRASLPSLDMAILSAAMTTGLELLVISEMPELNVAQFAMMQEGMGPNAPPNAGGSAGMFL